MFCGVWLWWWGDRKVAGARWWWGWSVLGSSVSRTGWRALGQWGLGGVSDGGRLALLDPPLPLVLRSSALLLLLWRHAGTVQVGGGGWEVGGMVCPLCWGLCLGAVWPRVFRMSAGVVQRELFCRLHEEGATAVTRRVVTCTICTNNRGVVIDGAISGVVWVSALNTTLHGATCSLNVAELLAVVALQHTT